MRIVLKLNTAIDRIIEAPDSDDVDAIMRMLIDELIDASIMGMELRLFLRCLNDELKKRIIIAADYLEINNIRKAMEFTEHINKVFEINAFQHELN